MEACSLSMRMSAVVVVVVVRFQVGSVSDVLFLPYSILNEKTKKTKLH
jgi:hypothetical protein